MRTVLGHYMGIRIVQSHFGWNVTGHAHLAEMIGWIRKHNLEVDEIEVSPRGWANVMETIDIPPGMIEIRTTT